MTLNCSQELVQMIIKAVYMCGYNSNKVDFKEMEKFYINHLDSLDGTALKAWDTFKEFECYGG